MYDEDDNYGYREMPSMRSHMDEANTGAPESVPELQTDTMGSTEQVGEKGYVYFIETQDAKFIKIGFSIKPIYRLGQLGTLMPIRLIGSFPASVATEQWLQRKFALHHTIGEWFHSTPEIRQFINTLGLIPPEELPLNDPKPKAEDGRVKNPAAVALSSLRMKRMTAEERAEVARQGGKASKAKLTPEQRSEIARIAGKAGGRGRKKKAK